MKKIFSALASGLMLAVGVTALYTSTDTFDQGLAVLLIVIGGALAHLGKDFNV